MAASMNWPRKANAFLTAPRGNADAVRDLIARFRDSYGPMGAIWSSTWTMRRT